MRSDTLLALPIHFTYRIKPAPDVVRDIMECLTSTSDLHVKHVVRLGKYGEIYELLGDGAVYDAVIAHPNNVNVVVHVIKLPNTQAAVAHSANVMIGGERRALFPNERFEVAMSVFMEFKEKALKVLNGTHADYTNKLMDSNRSREAMNVFKVVERRNKWIFLDSVLEAARTEISIIIRNDPNATSPKVFSWQTLTETALYTASNTVQKAVLDVLKRKSRDTIKVTTAGLKELIMREAEAEAEAAEAAPARARAEAEAEAVPRTDEADADAEARAEEAEALARAEEAMAMEAALNTTFETGLQMVHDKKNAIFVSIAESSAFHVAIDMAPPGEPDKDETCVACDVCSEWLHKPFYCTVCGFKMCLRCTVNAGINGTGAASATKVACPLQCPVPFATEASIHRTMAGKPPYNVLTHVCEAYVKVAMGKRKLMDV
jgi:hypothetical protein